MILCDYHIHTTYCDGNNTPEENILSAISMGMKKIGLCFHSYVPFDEEGCIKKEDISVFKEEIAVLKKKYRDKIEIFCGIEQDYYTKEAPKGYDYVIGSVHYIKKDDEVIFFDLNEETYKNAAEKYYGGDFYAFAEDYYKLASEVAEKTKATIIGHFDLFAKFNENNKYFDENSERYVNAYKKAADELLKYNIPFEINTGAISRGYKTQPYPNPEIMKYIKEKGGSFILSSDAHSKENICYGFEDFSVIT